jgi:KDO2-lipid IV(A) lauroyltransferase
LESFIAFVIARLTLFIFRHLPRHVGAAILNVLASIVYYLDSKHRHIADVNLQIALPDLTVRDRRRITKRSFQITAQNLLEVSRLTGLSRENIGSLVEYDSAAGWNNFEAAKARNKPILYLTGHFSAWELLPTAHALFGNPLSFVTRPLDNPWLERHITKAREAAGNTVISKKNSVRQILEKLKSSGSVGILMDHHRGCAFCPADRCHSASRLPYHRGARPLSHQVSPPSGSGANRRSSAGCNREHNPLQSSP